MTELIKNKLKLKNHPNQSNMQLILNTSSSNFQVTEQIKETKFKLIEVIEEAQTSKDEECFEEDNQTKQAIRQQHVLALKNFLYQKSKNS